jgi:hypothetical protein
LLSPEDDVEERLVEEGERPLPLRLSLSEEEEEDSLLRRLRLSFFDLFFLGLLRDLDDRVDAPFALVGVLLLVLVLVDPFSS